MTSLANKGQRSRAVVMADVAKLAGVSLQTVSRVINDSPHVRADTRERVQDAMRKLEYRPNPVARALVTGRSRTLGVVSFDTTLHGPASTLFGIERAAHEADYFVSIVSLRSLASSSVVSAVERLRDQGVDGILVIAPQESATSALLHLPEDVPVVAAEAGPDDSVPLVAVDQFEGAQLATSHLLELGHRTVWHISGPVDWLEAEDRPRGWRNKPDGAGARAPPAVPRDRSARAGAARSRPPVRPRRRCCTATGARGPDTSSVVASPPTPTSPRCSSPTTRWRSACCARCTRPAAGSRATSASSASTTSPRRSTSRPR